jgi:hypothetical protein
MSAPDQSQRPRWFATRPSPSSSGAVDQGAIKVSVAQIGVTIVARTVFIESATRFPLFGPILTVARERKGSCGMVHAPSGFQAGQHDWDVEPPARNDDRGNHEGDGMATALGGGFFAGAVQKKSPAQSKRSSASPQQCTAARF